MRYSLVMAKRPNPKMTRVGIGFTPDDLKALAAYREALKPECGHVTNSSAVRRAIRTCLEMTKRVNA